MTGFFLTTACKEKPEVEPNDSVTAKAGDDQSVQVGQVVTLDGSASASSEGKPLTYQWTILRKPAKSTVSLSDATSFKPTFKPDEVGEYELELTVTSPNGKGTDKVLVIASVAEPLAINANITVKTTLVDRIANPDLPDYIVTKNIDVNHELTINPGVVIAFERDVRMNVNDNGGLLIAKGEAASKIKFVGVQKTKGYWVGIALYSGSNANVLEYAEVSHAGSRAIYSTTKAALFFSGGSKAQMAIKNSAFTDNDGYGIYIYPEGILREFAENGFRNNTEAGILLDAANVAKLDYFTTFKGNNGRNVVEVTPSNLKNGAEVVWGGFADKAPYRINGELTVDTGWKLNPSVTLEMNRDAVIRINTSGYLSAIGTTKDKVIFTSADGSAAYWRGIICYSADPKTVLENAEVRNAGGNIIVSAKKANIAIWGTKATMTIKNTKISGSGGYGILIGYGSSANADLTTANTFESNAQTNVLIEK
ncbi:hypothetical protein GCM10007390_31650 [Persicitalea jodogahamensis]|uniref:Right handed beta helix domain-containing protein n=1 Tax=Persicitalea jodogahamensis TaxID=402147 RepID=A0A8J3DAC2_9BACT|nr:hypothetical protein GCM10007390_31650 [Persicitalea jodogahamensis]